MENIYTGSRSRYFTPDSMQDRWPPLPYENPNASLELSIAHGIRGIEKLRDLLLRSGTLTEAETATALNLVVRQLPASSLLVTNSGTLDLVCNLASSPSHDVRLDCARILQACTFEDSGAQRLLHLDASGVCDVALVFSRLRDEPDRHIRQYLLRACAQLSASKRVQQVVQQAQRSALLQALLDALPVSPMAAEAVSLFAAAGSAPTLLQLGAPHVLCQALRVDSQDPSPSSESLAFFALSGLRSLAAESEDAKEQVLTAGAMPLVLSALTHSSSRIRSVAVGVLASLVLVYNGVIQALQGGEARCVGPMVKLLYDGNQVTGATARAAIRTLVAGKEGKNTFIDALVRDRRTLVMVMETRASAELVARARDKSRMDRADCLLALVAIADASFELLSSIADAPGVVKMLREVVQGKGRDISRDMQEAGQHLVDKLSDEFPDMQLAFAP